MHPSDDLPEDHDSLLRLAQETAIDGPGAWPAAHRALPRQAPTARQVVAIPDEAGVLVAGPLVGFATHGR
jgi:hypothetical protein